jgi:3-amino-4-hydroxybenzoic acid synthase
MDDAIVTDELDVQAPTDGAPAARSHHLAWVDLRGASDERWPALVQAAVHHRIDGIVASDLARLRDLPPTITRVLWSDQPADLDGLDGVDVIVGDGSQPTGAGADRGVHVVVSDGPSLREACDVSRVAPWTVLTFTDPTKIPLEIVIAAAENASGRTVTVVDSVADAEIVVGVLEHGSDGVVLATDDPSDVVALARTCAGRAAPVEMCELTVESITHVGMGDRVCIDTCSLLGTDEGMLIGSFAHAMVLSCSETHPLPYMPTRPFRINAGAPHTYVMGPGNKTNYLSELRAGHTLLAVNVAGETREVVVGRAKIERRPMLSIDMRTPDGKACNLVVQDDWHVRLLGPGARVMNVTELTKGDRIMGHVPTEARHVGFPISEFCIEQ